MLKKAEDVLCFIRKDVVLNTNPKNTEAIIRKCRYHEVCILKTNIVLLYLVTNFILVGQVGLISHFLF